MAGFRVKDGNPVADKAPESIAKPREESPSAVRTTFRKKGEIPVYTNSLWRPPASAGEKMAHEKAKKLRETVKRLFGVDLDKPETVVDLSGGALAKLMDETPKTEWSKLEVPFAGMTERKANIAVSFGPVPFGMLSVRRVYDGDATEDEMAEFAKAFLAALEKECGEDLPESPDTAIAGGNGAKDAGIPAFGDLPFGEQALEKTHFERQIGDLAVSVKSAVPRYVRRNGKLEIAVKGAVVAEFVQSPVLGSDSRK